MLFTFSGTTVWLLAALRSNVALVVGVASLAAVILTSQLVTVLFKLHCKFPRLIPAALVATCKFHLDTAPLGNFNDWRCPCAIK